MNRNKFLPIALIVGIIVIVGIIIWQVMGGKGLLPEAWNGVEGDPVDVTLDFYESWLEARKNGPNEPFTAGMLDYAQVSPDLKAHLKTFEGQLTDETEDPVLCQIGVPDGLRTKPVFKQDESAQMLVMSKGATGQAVVSLEAKNGLWRISDISCGNGETGPQGEYSFEKSGFLLKQVPAPLDSNYWHLVFEEAGVLGHAVPLFIGDDSVCVQKDGTEVACNDDVLKETTPALVKGEMTETGVQVKRIELIDSVTIN